MGLNQGKCSVYAMCTLLCMCVVAVCMCVRVAAHVWRVCVSIWECVQLSGVCLWVGEGI